MATSPTSQSGSYSEEEGASRFDITSLSTSTSLALSPGSDIQGERLSDALVQDPSPTESDDAWCNGLSSFPHGDSFSAPFSPPDTGNALKRDGDRRCKHFQPVRFMDKESLRNEILDEAQMTPPLSLRSSEYVPTRLSTSDTNQGSRSRPTTSSTNQTFSKPLNTSSTNRTFTTIPESERTFSAQANDTLLEVMVKLDLLPCILALQASTRPNSGPEEAHRALNLATEAHANALRRGAEGALLGKCLYYIGLANFALGNVEDESTIQAFELAARLAPEEKGSAKMWVGFLEEQKRARVEERKEMSRRENSLLGWGPLQALGGLFSGSWSSAATRAEPGVGLYAQMAHARNRAKMLKPAKKRFALSTSSGGSSRAIPMAIPAAERMMLSTRSGGSQSSNGRGLPSCAGRTEDFNSPHSQSRASSKELAPSPTEISPTTHAKDCPPQRSPPAKLRLGNRRAATKSEHSEKDEDEMPVKSKRRSSWMRLSMNRPESPTKSLEALVEEGNSPMLSPNEFGKLKKGKSV